jgi:hypothetical protein
MKKIVACKPLQHYRVWLRFDDGIEGEVDLSEMAGKGVFVTWQDPEFFRQVQVDARGGIAWPGELDMCPDALYLEVTGIKPEDLFLALKEAQAHA